MNSLYLLYCDICNLCQKRPSPSPFSIVKKTCLNTTKMNSQSSSFPYIITLSSLDVNQLEEWFDHLDLVFEKTPRDYFVNHWINDPWKDINGVNIVFCFSPLQVFRLLLQQIHLITPRLLQLQSGLS